jgi:hypothetical protein
MGSKPLIGTLFLRSEEVPLNDQGIIDQPS